MRLLLLHIVLLFIISSLTAQNTLPVDTIMNRLYRQTQVYPQESIYLHTDKADYVAGDTIWFRAYIVNSVSKRVEPLSRYVYAELISPADTLVRRIRAGQDERQMIHGYLAIPYSLTQGKYLLRAYTRYAQNHDETSFFHKEINIYSNHVSAPSNTDKKKRRLSCRFFPGRRPVGFRRTQPYCFPRTRRKR